MLTYTTDRERSGVNHNRVLLEKNCPVDGLLRFVEGRCRCVLVVWRKALPFLVCGNSCQASVGSGRGESVL